VAERISSINRESTAGVYRSHWGAFRTWCIHRRLDPLKASVPKIDKFLMDLFNRGFQVSSIRGYRSAISSTLEHKGRHIGSNKDLTSLLKSLALSRPTRARTVPAWDLSIVLRMLNGELFEPLSMVDIKYLAYKTAFLLALASASRVSELHAIVVYSIQYVESIRYGEDYRGVSYSPALGFLSKTQSPEDTQRALAKITVMSLCETVGDRMSDDKKLCPMRALRH
jgi:hypothetical protein